MSAIVPLKDRPFRVRLFFALTWFLTRAGAWTTLFAVGRMRRKFLTGQKPDFEGGVLVAGNHKSFLDPPAFGSAWPATDTWIMARDTLFKNPVFGTAIRLVHAYPVKRGGADRATVRKTIEMLVAGANILMFPEGTRSPDGRPGKIREGFVTMLKRANVGMIPAYIHGAHVVWPKNRKLPVFGERLYVYFDRPMTRAECARLSKSGVVKMLRQRWQKIERIAAGETPCDSINL